MIPAKKATPRTEWPHTTPSITSNAESIDPEALVFANPGRRYRIEDFRFDSVRATCRELGCGEGSEVVCVENDMTGVSVLVDDGRRKFLGREYAWFVSICEIARPVELRPLSRIA